MGWGAVCVHQEVETQMSTSISHLPVIEKRLKLARNNWGKEFALVCFDIFFFLKKVRTLIHLKIKLVVVNTTVRQYIGIMLYVGIKDQTSNNDFESQDTEPKNS